MISKGVIIAVMQVRPDRRRGGAGHGQQAYRGLSGEIFSALYPVVPLFVEDKLSTTGLPLLEAFPRVVEFPTLGRDTGIGIHETVGSCLFQYALGLYGSGKAPIQPHRRLLGGLLPALSSGGPFFLQDLCSSVDERKAAINQRLAPIRDDAWKRRNHLAFAHGAFKRGYRLWEQEDEGRGEAGRDEIGGGKK
jgi:hypothetical protein